MAVGQQQQLPHTACLSTNVAVCALRELIGGCGRDLLSGKMKFARRAPPPTSKVANYALGGGKTATAVIFSAGKAPTGWLKGPAAGLGYKQKTWTRRHQNG